MKKIYDSFGVAPATRAGDFLFVGGLVAFNDDGSVAKSGAEFASGTAVEVESLATEGLIIEIDSIVHLGK